MPLSFLACDFQENMVSRIGTNKNIRGTLQLFEKQVCHSRHHSVKLHNENTLLQDYDLQSVDKLFLRHGNVPRSHY